MRTFIFIRYPADVLTLLMLLPIADVTPYDSTAPIPVPDLNRFSIIICPFFIPKSEINLNS